MTMEDFADYIKSYSMNLTRVILDSAGIPFSYEISKEVSDLVDRWLWDSGYYFKINDYRMISSIFAGASLALFIIGVAFGRFQK